MELQWFIGIVAGVGIGVVATRFLARRHNAALETKAVEKDDFKAAALSGTAMVAVPAAAQPFPAPAPERVADELLIGESPDRPVVTIRSTTSRAGFENAVTLDITSDPMSRFTGLLQAAPSLLVAQGSAGKRLMEVVIKGDLTAAADGSGFRAFAMQGTKIVEHGRLFDASKLQTMINVAAVWQVASVMVAQKHLADISQTLNELKAGVQGISRFLDQQRKARIQSTYDYLAQVAQAICAGELSPNTRGELESCERDLLEVHRHLMAEFRSVAQERVAHTETFGTKDLTRDIGKKTEKLKDLASDIVMCLRTRVGAWHVLSAFPGEARLIAARRASIEASYQNVPELSSLLHRELELDIGVVKSKLNRESTLRRRRAKLRSERDTADESLAFTIAQGVEAITRTMDRVLLRNQPTRILLTVENGQIVGASAAMGAPLTEDPLVGSCDRKPSSFRSR